MELVDGETLEEKLKTGPLPVPESLQVALQIADALEAAQPAERDRRCPYRDR